MLFNLLNQPPISFPNQSASRDESLNPNAATPKDATGWNLLVVSQFAVTPLISTVAFSAVNLRHSVKRETVSNGFHSEHNQYSPG
jgi:hypothetical protein